MKVLAENKKVFFNYHVLEKFEAGLVLLGHEVKSVKLGQMNLKASYISFHKNKKKSFEAYLVNSYIPLYKPAGQQDDYDPERERKILLKRKEIDYLMGRKEEQGLTLVPVKVYTSSSLVKIEIALVKGKKLFDKREDSKKRDLDKKIRTLTKKKLKEE
jgi:SsrA-binding protein